MRKFKDQIRVTAQLINVEDGSHYWSKNMDKKTDNLFEIQDAIAREVAEAMQLTLQTGATTQRKVKWNEESQKLYQQGRYFYDRLDDSTANDLLKRSVALDSNQAISHLYLSFNSSNLNLADSLISDLHLKKAFSLDPQLTEAHTAAALNYLQAFKFDKAWNEINIALSNGSNNPVTLRNAGRVYMAMGKSAEAVAFARKAVELDPLQTRSWNYLSEILYCDRNYSEVLRIMDQQQIDRYIRRFSCLVLLSKFKEAREEIHLIKDLEVREYFTLLLDASMGKKIVLSEKYNNNPLYAYELAVLYANAGNVERALKHLELAINSKQENAWLISVDPMLDPLRKEPGFVRLLKKMNYPRLD